MTGGGQLTLRSTPMRVVTREEAEQMPTNRRRSARAPLASATEMLKLSARGAYRVLRVARTIADLEKSADVTASHVAEAKRYRSCEC